VRGGVENRRRALSEYRMRIFTGIEGWGVKNRVGKAFTG